MAINTPFSISEMVFLAEALRAGQATKPLANTVCWSNSKRRQGTANKSTDTTSKCQPPKVQSSVDKGRE